MDDEQKWYIMEFKKDVPLWKLERRGLGLVGHLKVRDGHPQLLLRKKDLIYARNKARGFRGIIYEEKYNRSTNYRNVFFRNNPSEGTTLFSKEPYWRCRYCGKRLTRKKVHIDHIIPVYKAKRFSKWQKKLPYGVNAPENLAASCKMCNLMKGKKTSIWRFRAKLGSYPMFLKTWRVIHIAFIVVLMCVLIRVCGAEIVNNLPLNF